MNARELQAALADCKPAGAAAPMAGTVQDISVQQLSTKVTSMSFFDRLLDEGEPPWPASCTCKGDMPSASPPSQAL